MSHPTLPVLITAHEDRYIRFFDINTGRLNYNTKTVLKTTDLGEQSETQSVWTLLESINGQVSLCLKLTLKGLVNFTFCNW